MEQNRSLFKAFFSFNLSIVAGIIIGLFVNAIATEIRPVSSFLFEPTLYIVTSVLAATIRLVLWLVLDKGTLFEIKQLIIQIIQDILVINAVVLSTLSFIFIIETYFQ